MSTQETELFPNISSKDFLHFQFKSLIYETQLAETQVKTGQLCGVRVFKRVDHVYVNLNFQFFGGSLGCAEGEKIQRAADVCIKEKLAFVIDAQSGGVRMQEGVQALMQMSATVTKVEEMKKNGILTISVFRDPCYGGTSASFMYATHIQIGIKGARLGFAGPNVIKNTIFEGDQKLYDETVPPGFQTVERTSMKGYCDIIAENEVDLDKIIKRIVKSVKPSELQAQEADSEPQAQYEQFSYKECRGPQHKASDFYTKQLFTDELLFTSDGAIQVSFATFKGKEVLAIYNKINPTSPLSGLGSPIGYRQAAKFVNLASGFNMPVVTIIDTAGALPSPEAEDQCQAQAISECLASFSKCHSMIVSVVTGEGGSGGALALLGGNVVACLSKSFYNVISPEGGVSILQEAVYAKNEQQKMKDDFPFNCESLANTQKCYSFDIYDLHIVDFVININSGAKGISSFITSSLSNFSKFSGEDLRTQRQQRFAKLSSFNEVENVQVGLQKAQVILKGSPPAPHKESKKAPTTTNEVVSKTLQYIAERTLIDKQYEVTEIKIPDIEHHSNKIIPTIKQLLASQGPKAVQEAILNHKNYYITDTSFRDAHQSLAATRLRTKELLQAAHMLEKTNLPYQDLLFSVECWGGATFDTAMRFLYEDPWERLSLMNQALPNTLTQMLVRGANAVGYTRYPDNVVEEFIIQAAQSGLDVFRVFDAFNDLDQMALCVDTVLKKTNKLVEVSICFSGNFLDENEKIYTLDYFKDVATKIYARWPDMHILAIKDMAGLVTPPMAKPLMQVLRDATHNKIPIHFHTHDTAGGQIATCLAMIEAGVNIVDVASASVSGLTSQPCMQTLLKFTERCDILDNLQTYDSVWQQIRSIYSQVYETDTATIRSPCADIYMHQMPGGQISNLHQQCIQMGLGEKFEELKKLYAVVNDMLGNVIKVTPSSKIVGDLALFMLQNNFTKEQVLDPVQMRTVNFPESVKDFLKGGLGVPHVGLNQQLIKSVFQITDEQAKNWKLENKKLDNVNLVDLEKKVQQIRPWGNCRLDVLSYCFYQKVFQDFVKFEQTYGRLTKNLGACVFMHGMKVGMTIKLNNTETEQIHMITLKRIKNANMNGDQQLEFSVDGITVNIDVKKKKEVPKQIVMAGDNEKDHASLVLGVIESISVKKNEFVKKGQYLLKIASSKLEVKIYAKKDGIIKELLKEGDKVVPGALVATVE